MRKPNHFPAKMQAKLIFRRCQQIACYLHVKAVLLHSICFMCLVCEYDRIISFYSLFKPKQFVAMFFAELMLRIHFRQFSKLNSNARFLQKVKSCGTTNNVPNIQHTDNNKLFVTLKRIFPEKILECIIMVIKAEMLEHVLNRFQRNFIPFSSCVFLFHFSCTFLHVRFMFFPRGWSSFSLSTFERWKCLNKMDDFMPFPRQKFFVQTH